ncbi:MAG: hypothetical protein EAZ10_19185, partial [Oscillatoriales cyanobacterium]
MLEIDLIAYVRGDLFSKLKFFMDPKQLMFSTTKDSICYVWEITPSFGRFFFDQDSTGSQTNIVFTESGTYTISAQTFFHPFYGGSCANASCGEI